MLTQVKKANELAYTINDLENRIWATRKQQIWWLYFVFLECNIWIIWKVFPCFVGMQLAISLAPCIDSWSCMGWIDACRHVPLVAWVLCNIVSWPWPYMFCWRSCMVGLGRCRHGCCANVHACMVWIDVIEYWCMHAACMQGSFLVFCTCFAARHACCMIYTYKLVCLHACLHALYMCMHEHACDTCGYMCCMWLCACLLVLLFACLLGMSCMCWKWLHVWLSMLGNACLFACMCAWIYNACGCMIQSLKHGLAVHAWHVWCRHACLLEMCV